MVSNHGEDDDSIDIIDIEEVREDAFNMGYDRFSGYDEPEGQFDFAPFTDSAEWCNSILPRLRQMVGYDDPTGRRTFTDGDVLVQPNNQDDPCGAHHLLDTVVESYRQGAYEAAHFEDE